MRVIKEINLANALKATVFSWNGKYIIKIEQGHLEQTYKISEMEIADLPDLELWLNSPDFQINILKVFMQMEENLNGVR